MNVRQFTWSGDRGWSPEALQPGPADLVVLFGSTASLSNHDAVGSIGSHFPQATLVGCSSAGEIVDTRVQDDSLVATAIRFEHTRCRTAWTPISAATSQAAGRRLADTLDAPGLAHVFVLSEGLHVNGSALVRGFADVLGHGVVLTGGLAGDGNRFARTVVLAHDHAREGIVAAVGLYGDRIRVGHGSVGGWDPFGPHRRVTHAQDNVLYELDGEPALQLYRRYLGCHADELPHSGLFFPLSLSHSKGEGLVRTILAVDGAAGSITLAGDVPEGAMVRLMKANVSRLVDGATRAATASTAAMAGTRAELAILVSCVGRRLVLRQRVEEELESTRQALGPHPTFTGFYSYGEISPFQPTARCELHNQTMTVTTWAEA